MERIWRVAEWKICNASSIRRVRQRAARSPQSLSGSARTWRSKAKYGGQGIMWYALTAAFLRFAEKLIKSPLTIKDEPPVPDSAWSIKVYITLIGWLFWGSQVCYAFFSLPVGSSCFKLSHLLWFLYVDKIIICEINLCNGCFWENVVRNSPQPTKSSA